MKQSLQLRTSQHLALTPQLQQSIRLLQLSTLELHQELEQILSDNPLLERMDDPLDHSVRLLADGAISHTASTSEGSEASSNENAETAGDGGTEAAFDGTEMPEAPVGSDNDWSFDDVARSAKAPEDDDGRPQLGMQECSLRDHLLEQARVTLHEQRDYVLDRKSTRLNSSHIQKSRMPSSA